MHRLLRAALAAIPLALCHVPQAIAEVIDEIAIERSDSGVQLRLRFTGPVHYLRQAVSANGVVANVYLKALDPQAFGAVPPIDEVKRFPGDASVPPAEVRVRRDPRCDPTANPVCILIRFEHTARYKVRLGEDRRSLVVDFGPDARGRSPNAAKER